MFWQLTSGAPLWRWLSFGNTMSWTLDDLIIIPFIKNGNYDLALKKFSRTRCALWTSSATIMC